MLQQGKDPLKDYKPTQREINGRNNPKETHNLNTFNKNCHKIRPQKLIYTNSICEKENSSEKKTLEHPQ